MAGRWLVRQLMAERERWILWTPVLFGLGIALYFALPAEPPLGLAAFALAFALAAPALIHRHPQLGHRPGLFRCVGALALVAAGFAVVQWRAHSVEAPVIPYPSFYKFEGRVAFVEPHGDGQRIVFDHLAFERLEPEETPATVRATVRAGQDRFVIGDRLAVTARLQRPSGPMLPGGFDYARQAYFDRLGGIGFAVGDIERLEEGRETSFAAFMGGLRQHIAEEAQRIIGGASGAVAGAVITGLRASIPEWVWRAMQMSGLAHLLAISGLHVGLAAGTMFLFARYLLALIPPLALRLPAKKPAAAVGLVAAFCYLLLAGATVPTQRAFMMLGIGLTAIMVDRNPLSMRLVALAAFVVLLIQPESLLGASFQMSFAAVVALIAFYEGRPPMFRRQDRDGGGGLGQPSVVYFLGVLVTTIIASFATTPFAAVHFQRVATFGLVANIVAVPLTAFWIMPSGLLALLLMPLGLHEPLFMLMGKGVDVLLAVAVFCADLPHAGLLVTQKPGAVILLFSLGGLWIAIWRRPWRWCGLGLWAAALIAAFLARPPDLVIHPYGDMVAVRLDDGRVRLATYQRDGFVERSWLRALGVESAEPWPEPGAGEVDGIACDPSACIVRLGHRRVSIAPTAAGVFEDCRLVDLVIATGGVEQCTGPARFIGSDRLQRSEGMALHEDDGHLTLREVQAERGDRLWSR